MRKAVFIVAAFRDIIRNRLCVITAIAHADTQTAVLQHIIVIRRVTKGNHLFRGYLVKFTEFFQSIGLGNR